MKRISMFVILAALLAIGASALQVGSPTFGGETIDRVQNATSSIVLTNNDNQTLSNIAVTFAADVKYNLRNGTVPATVSANSQATISVVGNIPVDHPGIDSTTLKPAAINVGTFTLTGTLSNGSQVTATGNVMMQAVNQLEIKKVRIECDTKTDTVSDGDKVKNLKPGQDCQLTIEVENKFAEDDRNGQKIGDISFPTIRVDVESSDDDQVEVDCDEEDIDDLDADQTDEITCDLEIDEEADDKSSSIDIRVTSNDANGALQGEGLNFKMEVVRLTHDVQIRGVEVAPSRVSNCDPSSVKLTVSLLNQGKRDEKRVAVSVSSADLKFEKKVQDLELDKDDSASVSFDVPVPAGQKRGAVRFEVRSFFENTAQSNQATVDLTVEDCDAESEETESGSVSTPPQTFTQPPVVTAPPAGSVISAPKQTSSFTDSPAYVALLAVVSVAVLVALVLMVSALVRRRAE